MNHSLSCHLIPPLFMKYYLSVNILFCSLHHFASLFTAGAFFIDMRLTVPPPSETIS